MDFDLITKQIQPDLIFDIGCNIGGWYKEAKNHWPRAEFILIDGNSECAPALAELGVKYYIAVLSNIEKEVDFFTLKDCGTAVGSSYYREKTSFFEDDKVVTTKRPTITLDNLMIGFPCQNRKILIKLDTQGSELDILEGAKRILLWTDSLIMEISAIEYNEGAPNAMDSLIYMSKHGFRPIATVGNIVHPIDRTLIQWDVLFRRFS